MNLPAEEREACAEFEEEILDVIDQGSFHFTLLAFVGGPKEIK